MLSGKVFLITGSTGRLGCETVARLEDLGAKVLPIVLTGYHRTPGRVKWAAKTSPITVDEAGDLRNIKTPDYVINFHWLVDRSLSFTGQLQYELEWALHRISFFWDWLKEVSFNRLINISSTKVFSHLNNNPISNDTDPRPASPYGLAKLTAERFMDNLFFQSDFPVVHLRLCSVASYGEHQSQLLSQLFKSCYENTPIKINAGHIVNILYIDEAVDLIINAALQSDKSKYLLTTPSMAVDDIASKFEKISGKKINGEYVDLNPGVINPEFESDIKSLSAEWVRHTTVDLLIKKIIEQNLIHSTNAVGLDTKF